jgi:hypothetical protein
MTRPWLNHEYLAEVLFALGHRAVGWTGLGMLQVLALLGTLAALAWAGRVQREPTAEPAPPSLAPSLVIYAIAALILRESIAPRAQLLSNLLFALTLALAVGESRSAPGAAPRHGLLLTVPIGLVWTQVHGGNVTGVALLGLLLLSRPTVHRASYALLGAVATCVGPYGWHVHEHFLQARAVLPVIREWQPLHRSLGTNPVFTASVLALLAAAALALVARARRGERCRFLALSLAFFSAAALRYCRFANEATIVACACLAPTLSRLPVASWRRWPRVVSSGVAAAVLLVLAAGVAGSTRTLGVGLDPRRFPARAVEHIRRTRPPGPLFNAYNFGGYLIWALPEHKVFIDGRAFTVYPEEHVSGLLALYADPPRFRRLEARFGFRLAILPRRSAVSGPLLLWLRRQPGWRVTYEDDVATVLVRS